MITTTHERAETLAASFWGMEWPDFVARCRVERVGPGMLTEVGFILAKQIGENKVQYAGECLEKHVYLASASREFRENFPCSLFASVQILRIARMCFYSETVLRA